MADESGRAVLKIPIDTAAWDSFVDKFQAYQSSLEKQPEAWGGTNQQIKGVAKSFDAVESSFDKLVKAAINPAFSDKGSGTFARFEKSSKTTATYWKDTTRNLEKSSKYFDNFVRSGIKWESLAKLGGGALGLGIGLVGGGIAATDKAANNLAAQNQLNRMLGLKPGEQQAFTNAYGPAGADDALLAKIADAKSDPSKWNGLRASGIGTDEIVSKDPEALAAEFLQKAGAQFKHYGIQGGQWVRISAMVISDSGST